MVSGFGFPDSGFGYRGCFAIAGKVDTRLPGKGNLNSHGARPVNQIISMIKWIRTSRLSIQNSLSLCFGMRCDCVKSPRSSYTGLYPQSDFTRGCIPRVTLHGVVSPE